jgi:hypothetical protein
VERDVPITVQMDGAASFGLAGRPTTGIKYL